MPDLALRLALLAALSGVVPATVADTETYYKWRDKDGNITYQTKPPPKDATRIEKIQYDPDANVVPAEPVPGGAAAGTQDQGSSRDDSTVRRALDERGSDLGAAQREALDTGDSVDAPDGGADTADGAATADPADASPAADTAPGADTAPPGDLAPGADVGSTATGAATGSAAGTAAGAPVAAPPPLPPAAPLGP